MKRRNFIKQLALAAPLPWLSGITLAAADANAKPGSHKILTCNVRVDVPADSKTGDGWAQRREFCANVMKEQHADLIGLQEAQVAHVSFLREQMPEFDSFALRDKDGSFHTNNTMFFRRARYELLSSGGFWLSETPQVAGSKSWDTANARLVNWVQLKERTSGQEFRWWNTHLDHKGAKARDKGSMMIVDASSKLPKDFPQLLTGDMNSHVTSPAIKNYKAAGWTDTYAAVNGPTDPGFTAHGFKGIDNPPKNADGKLKGKIDWIFCRGPVKPLSAAIIRDSRNGHYPSDHYFISAEVLIG